MSRSLLRSAALLFALLAFGGCSDIGEKPYYRPGEVVWADVARWSGDGWKTTETVRVDTHRWRMVITGRAPTPDGGQWVWVNMYESDGTLMGRASIGSARSDTTYVHNHKGVYYFEVQQRNLDWEIVVQQPRRPAEEQDSL